MFCTTCRGALAVNSRFCNHCGEPVPGEAEIEAAAAEWTAGSDQTAASAAAEWTAGSDQTAASAAAEWTAGSDQTAASAAAEWTAASDQTAASAAAVWTAANDQTAASAAAYGRVGEASLLDDHGSLNGEEPRMEEQRSDGGTAAEAQGKRKFARLWLYLLPVSCLLMVLIAGAADYWYQSHQTEQAKKLLTSSEELALAGKYAEAQQQVDQALALRPTHAVLLDNRLILADVMKLDGSLQAADKEAGAKQYEQAIKDIRALQQAIASRSGPIYKKLGAQVDSKEEAFVVGQVKDSIAAKKTANELLPLLETLKPYKGEEAKSAVKNVKQKIVDISYELSSSALQSRNFEKALAIVTDALKQDDGNEKLLGLQVTIREQQKAFEEAEQQRIQKAIEASTKEDMNNRTNGVQLNAIHAGVDDYGYFKISGEVKNIATRQVSSVTVYYDLLDDYGNVLYHDTVYVSPYSLAIGDTGSFSNSYYYDGYMASATVTRMEWQLD